MDMSAAFGWALPEDHFNSTFASGAAAIPGQARQRERRRGLWMVMRVREIGCVYALLYAWLDMWCLARAAKLGIMIYKAEDL